MHAAEATECVPRKSSFRGAEAIARLVMNRRVACYIHPGCRLQALVLSWKIVGLTVSM